jgi:hypothetical protein
VLDTKKIEPLILDVCVKLQFDIAMLYAIESSALKIVEIFGDDFSRPDVGVGMQIASAGERFENEFVLAADDGDCSFITIPGFGADCGLRIKGSPYVLTFDCVGNDDDDEGLTAADREVLSDLQSTLEKSLA